LVRGEGILTEGSISTALIRTAYWRMVREQPNAKHDG
jgi:hypothetical protein